MKDKVNLIAIDQISRLSHVKIKSLEVNKNCPGSVLELKSIHLLFSTELFFLINSFD